MPDAHITTGHTTPNIDATQSIKIPDCSKCARCLKKSEFKAIYLAVKDAIHNDLKITRTELIGLAKEILRELNDAAISEMREHTLSKIGEAITELSSERIMQICIKDAMASKNMYGKRWADELMHGIIDAASGRVSISVLPEENSKK